MYELALVYEAVSAFDKAEDLALKVRDAIRRREGEDSDQMIYAVSLTGDIYCQTFRYDEAAKMVEKKLALSRRIHGDRDGVTLSAMSSLPAIYEGQGRYDKAEELALQAVQGFREGEGPYAISTLRALRNLGQLYEKTHRDNRAAACLEEVLAGLRRIAGDGDAETIEAMDLLAQLYLRRGEYPKAEPLLREVCQWRLVRRGPRNLAPLDEQIARLVACYCPLGQPQKAMEWRAWSAVALPPPTPAPRAASATPPSCAGVRTARAVSKGGRTVCRHSRNATVPAAARVPPVIPRCGDEAGYRATREQMLHRGAKPSRVDALTALSVAQAGLLAQLAQRDLDMTLQYVERAGAPDTRPTTAPSAGTTRAAVPAATAPTSQVADESGSLQLPLVRGMVEYRRDNPLAATDWLERCRRGLARGDGYQRVMQPYAAWDAAACFYQAMAECKLGHPEGAHAALATGPNVLKNGVEQADSAEWNVSTMAWLTAHIAAREAEAVVGTRGSGGPAASPPPALNPRPSRSSTAAPRS